jgi:hypothetical protein
VASNAIDHPSLGHNNNGCYYGGGGGARAQQEEEDNDDDEDTLDGDGNKLNNQHALIVQRNQLNIKY